MIGPAGTGGCSRFSCMEKSVATIVSEVTHPGRVPYVNEYYFCKPHLDNFFGHRHNYPNFEIKEIIC